MNRKVLLIEPNYKNKYPPMPLMKLASYYRELGDDVRFYKGDLRNLAVDLICQDLIKYLNLSFGYTSWNTYYPVLFKFIKIGRYSILEDEDELTDDDVLDAIKSYRKKYKDGHYFKYPHFDVVCITTLFTFYWDITIKTINFAKQLCKNIKNVHVGGIAASILPDEMYKETGIHPIRGLLNKPRMLDENDLVIDTMPLDYSILEEIDYVYPAHDAYFAYMTRGCINHCDFCAVPKLEPNYCDYVNLSKQINATRERFGERRDLLLLDNNVLASKLYPKIIDDIKNYGFGVGATYTPPNEYDIAIKNLRDGYNDKAYIKKIVKMYKEINSKLKSEEEKQDLYRELSYEECLEYYTATKEAILRLDKFIKPLYDKTHIRNKRKRIVDFNQGIDSRLVNDENMHLLSQVNIFPLRIAFDHWELRDIYVRAVKSAVSNGIKGLSNYLLYNFNDKPEELYYRLQMNVNLCDELGANIYSFPMKYHPIDDPDYFRNRDFIGKHWNRKFIRAVQAILNSTKGKVGRGRDFFEEAFGQDVDEFHKLLWMPEAFIIYRRKYDAKLRERLAERYIPKEDEDSDLANEWWEKFSSLPSHDKDQIKPIIASNDFDNYDESIISEPAKEVLKYYKISR